MINYPKNYAPLAEEEMEYTSGGLSINWMALLSLIHISEPTRPY
mgnify:CR=1 FL=1